MREGSRSVLPSQRVRLGILRLGTSNLRLSFSGRPSVHHRGSRRPRDRRSEGRCARICHHLENSHPPVRSRPDGAQYALGAPPDDRRAPVRRRLEDSRPPVRRARARRHLEDSRPGAQRALDAPTQLEL